MLYPVSSTLSYSWAEPEARAKPPLSPQERFSLRLDQYLGNLLTAARGATPRCMKMQLSAFSFRSGPKDCPEIPPIQALALPRVSDISPQVQWVADAVTLTGRGVGFESAMHSRHWWRTVAFSQRLKSAPPSLQLALDSLQSRGCELGAHAYAQVQCRLQLHPHDLATSLRL